MEKLISKGSVFIAETTDGQIIGFSTGGKEQSNIYSHYSGELFAIYILKAYQRKGIGKLLVKPVVE